MSDLKRTWPRRRAAQGFFFGGEALGLSLEATGLAAYIFSWDGDEIDDEILKAMFPDRDLTGPIAELAAAGVIDFVDPDTPRVATPVEREEPRPYKRPGIIYLIEGGGRYKIGISQSSVKKRLVSLQTGSPVPLKVVHSATVRDCSTAEQLAHGLLTRFRLHGEWFECTEERALSVLKTVIEAIGEK